MKNSMSLPLLFILATAVVLGCGNSPATTDLAAPQGDATAPAADNAAFTGEVVETMDAANYTYVLVDNGTKKVWAATNRFNVAVGDRVTFALGTPMANFHSDSLDRDFDVVYFTSEIVPEGTPLASAQPAMGDDEMVGHTSAPDAGVEAGSIATPEGGMTIADLWAKRQDLAGKSVTVSGKVVKFNGGILGTNWIHIQDGSGDKAAGNNDLAVTSPVSVAVGDVVTVTGAVTLDRDFGAGYRYDLIILDADVAPVK